jgi:hypothetical protein
MKKKSKELTVSSDKPKVTSPLFGGDEHELAVIKIENTAEPVKKVRKLLIYKVFSVDLFCHVFSILTDDQDAVGQGVFQVTKASHHDPGPHYELDHKQHGLLWFNIQHDRAGRKSVR